MNEDADIPLTPSRKPDPQNKQLQAIFIELDSKQLEVFDSAAKSIIERVATLLTVVFGITAFGDTFPPAYLQHDWVRWPLLASLGLYLVAMGLAMWATYPRAYTTNMKSVNSMQATLDLMLKRKRRAVAAAHSAFLLASLALITTISILVW